MIKQLTPHHKIQLLLLTMKVINLYNSPYYIKINKYIAQIPKKIKSNSILPNLEYINLIYINATKQDLTKLIILLIKEYNQKHFSKILSNYEHKYIQLYSEFITYYDSESSIEERNIKNIAITNLYILNQVSKKNGIYFLIKYLFL